MIFLARLYIIYIISVLAYEKIPCMHAQDSVYTGWRWSGPTSKIHGHATTSNFSQTMQRNIMELKNQD
jgi:hypothetical protein